MAAVVQLDAHVLVPQTLVETGDHEVDDLDDLVLRELREHDHVVDAVEELGLEVLLELVVDLDLHPLVRRRGSPTGLEAGPDAVGDVPVPRFVVMMMTVFLKSTIATLRSRSGDRPRGSAAAS